MDAVFIGAIIGLGAFPVMAIWGGLLLRLRQWNLAIGALLTGLGIPILLVLAIVGVITQLWHLIPCFLILGFVGLRLIMYLEDRFPTEPRTVDCESS